MIRIVLFLAAIVLLAFGANWLADRPGEVVMVWQGWRVSTSVAVALAALVVLVVLALLVWSILRLLFRAPGRVAQYVQERRELRGWRAVSRGLIAVGTGNLTLAQDSAGEAQKLLGEEPLTRLLAAQAAQLGGDAAKAESEFRSMLEHDETKLLGLHGLFVEARRRGDAAAAFAFAEEAAKLDPALGWAGDALVEFHCRAGDWTSALKAVERQIAAGAVGRTAGKRKRAVLVTARAMTLEETDPPRARELANDAAGLAPDLVPAVALAGRLEGSAGNVRRGARIIERAWTANPHPELADAYADLKPGDTSQDRLNRVKTLAQRAPDNPESGIAVAREAIDAQEFGVAREALAKLIREPTQRVCLLMAEIEASEHGDHGKAREWTARAVRARRDPAWVADGYVSERWLPASPLTGRVDAFVWQVPPETLSGPLLEQVAEQALAAIPARTENPEPRPETIPIIEAPALTRLDEPVREREAPERPRPARPVVAEPPLPDDPGPEPDGERTPVAASDRRGFRLFNWLGGSAP